MSIMAAITKKNLEAAVGGSVETGSYQVCCIT